MYLFAFFNPFPPSVPIWHRLAKLSILILEGIIKKIMQLLAAVLDMIQLNDDSLDEKSLS